MAILLPPTSNHNHHRSSFHNSIPQASSWQSYCPQQATVTIKEIFLSQLHPSNIFVAILLPPTSNLNHQRDLPFTTPSLKHLCGILTATNKQPYPSKRSSFHNSIPQASSWQSYCPQHATVTIKEIFLSQLHLTNIFLAILLLPSNNLNHQRDLPFTTPSLKHLCGNPTAPIKQP